MFQLIPEGKAQIVADNMGTVHVSFRVYARKGHENYMYHSFPTKEAAEEYCEQNGWVVW